MVVRKMNYEVDGSSGVTGTDRIYHAHRGYLIRVLFRVSVFLFGRSSYLRTHVVRYIVAVKPPAAEPALLSTNRSRSRARYRAYRADAPL